MGSTVARTTIPALVLVLLGGACLWSGSHERPPAPAPLPVRPFSVELPASGPTTGPDAPERPERALPPSTLSIPSIGVRAPIVVEDVNGAGELIVPGDPDAVGLAGPLAPLSGDLGTTLVAGHVSFDGEPGALHSLVDAAPGAVVRTSDREGAVRVWRVTGLEAVRKDRLPEFSAGGPRRLVIVTCGGTLTRRHDDWSFDQNVIVTAVPA